MITLNFKWMALVVVACISALGCASYYCYNSSNQRNIAVSGSGSIHELNTRYTSPPPPYNEEHEMNDDGSVPVSYELRITEHPINDKQKAVPFPFFYDNSVSNDGSNNGQIGGVQSPENTGNNTTDSAFTVPSLDIHDETTTPSFWTPGPAHGAVASNNETVKDDEKISPPCKRKRIDESSCKQAQKGSE